MPRYECPDKIPSRNAPPVVSVSSDDIFIVEIAGERKTISLEEMLSLQSQINAQISVYLVDKIKNG